MSPGSAPAAPELRVYPRPPVALGIMDPTTCTERTSGGTPVLRSILVVAALLVASAPLRAEIIRVDITGLEQLRDSGRARHRPSHSRGMERHRRRRRQPPRDLRRRGRTLRHRRVGVAARGNRCSGRTHCAHLLEWKAEQHRRPHPGPAVRLGEGAQRVRRNEAMARRGSGDRPPLSSLSGSVSGRSVAASLRAL